MLSAEMPIRNEKKEVEKMANFPLPPGQAKKRRKPEPKPAPRVGNR